MLLAIPREYVCFEIANKLIFINSESKFKIHTKIGH